ncbi:hypothetical protein [Clostridium sp.]|uniref:hypothetical protein n=1 Tax=Clostridium sp. TaxID=1506 RepID=UPI00284CC2C0|nr:hypothetical protein [Clostridium sp.]MDR3593573.1 hypothetical protein [Clostridium sp.]
MKINLLKDQIVEIDLGSEECSLVVEGKTFTEQITALDVAMVGKSYDKKFSNSFIRNIYKRCIGIGANEYRMCIDYSFEV